MSFIVKGLSSAKELTASGIPGLGSTTTAEERPGTQTVFEPDGHVLCKACSAVITQKRHTIEVEGSHEHTFRNPWGYSFHLLCFGAAEGATSQGTPTAEATWFASYQWSFASCADSGTHLGWFFVKQGGASVESFAGLIATRLVRPK
jgi:hypothetical protein